MPPYRGIEYDRIPYSQKCVRSGNNVFVSAPNQRMRAEHLAHTEGIYKEVMRRKKEEPTTADAGQLSVFRQGERVIVELSGFSSDLNIPVHEVAEETRMESVRIIQESTPDAEVIGTTKIMPTLYRD